MSEDRIKTGVTVVSVPRKENGSAHRKKFRRERSIKVTPINRNSANKIKTVRLMEENIHKNDDNEEQTLPHNSNLEDKTTTSIPFNEYESETLSSIPIHSSTLEFIELSSVHENNRINSKPITSSKINRHPISTTSSFNKSFISLYNDNNTSMDLSKKQPIEDYQEKKPKRRSRRYTNTNIEKGSKKSTINNEIDEINKKTRRRRICKMCPACSNCCCLASILASLLLLAGLAALLVFLLTRQDITTTTTTTTTSTSVTTSTTTTSTSTTSTSSTTSTTSTSTSTSSTTSTTSVTTTTTTTTSSTSTSSTSTTSKTTTTSSSTSSETTTTTTPSPPCTPSSVGSASTIYSTLSGTGLTTYKCFAYEWTPITSGLITLAFQLRHDPDYWFLDNVSVYAGAVQMLSNGGFETGSLSPWIRTTPNGNCAGSAGQVSSSSPYSGTYSFRDGSNGCADQVSQQFMATAGQSYIVSFWLKSGSTGSTISATVTLS